MLKKHSAKAFSSVIWFNIKSHYCTVSRLIKQSINRTEIDSKHGNAYYFIIEYDYWNKGIMTEAAKAVIDYLFAEVGVNRVGISHAVKNPASGKVAQKCGLTYEGTKREYYKTSNGEFLDISEYGILRREWKNSWA